MPLSQTASLSKGLKLLQAILLDRGHSTLTELSRQVGLPVSTAHRLVKILQSEGFVEQPIKGCLLAGPACQIMSQAGINQRERLTAMFRPLLSRLAQQYDAACHFGVLDDGMVTYLIKSETASAALFTREDMQLEAYCSAIGKVLLAALPGDELENYLAGGPFVPLTTNTIVDPAGIRAELERVRCAGVAYDMFEIREDLFCLAVPVKDRNGDVVGGLSCSLCRTVADPSDNRRIARALRRIASYAKRL